MHEYRLCEDYPQGSPNFVRAFALCCVVKKNEHAQKIDDLQGEPKAKRRNTGPRNHVCGSAYLPSFPNPVHCMGLYNNGENMDLHSFEWDVPQFIYPPTNDT